MASVLPPPLSWRLYGAVLLVRFERPPDLETATMMLELTRAHASDEQKLSFVGVVPDQLQVPSTAFRQTLTAQSAVIRGQAFSLHFAIEGKGLMANLQRGMLSALATFVSIGVPFSIHASGQDALIEAGKQRKLMMLEAVNDARRRGLIR